MIDDKDISFVVQGPVCRYWGHEHMNNITKRCLDSIRSFFPQSCIVLSTWKDQDLSDLAFDELLELNDPGINIVTINGEEKQLNANRQLYSTHCGLAAVKTKYAVKLRSDQLITGRGFVELYEKHADLPRDADVSLFKQRTITSSAFFISSHYGNPIYFHKNDFFDFGLTEDLLKIWPEQQLGQLSFLPRIEYKSREPATEQYLVLHWLGLLLGKNLFIHNKTLDHAGLGNDYWEKFVANNLIIAEPERLCLDVTERFKQRGNQVLEYDIKDWLYLSGVGKKPVDIKRIYRQFREFEGKCLRYFNR